MNEFDLYTHPKIKILALEVKRSIEVGFYLDEIICRTEHNKCQRINKA